MSPRPLLSCLFCFLVDQAEGISGVENRTTAQDFIDAF